jgi:hypothetical protein
MNSGKNKLHGASFVGILFGGAALAFAGIVGAQGVPADAEIWMMGPTADQLKVASTPAEIRSSFDQAGLVDAIKFIASNGLLFTQKGTKSVVSFDDTKEIYLATAALLLTKYAGSSH